MGSFTIATVPFPKRTVSALVVYANRLSKPRETSVTQISTQLLTIGTAFRPVPVPDPELLMERATAMLPRTTPLCLFRRKITEICVMTLGIL